MTSQQTIIFIGDLVRALKGLEAGDDSARQAIAELLGFAAPDAPVAPQSEELLPTPQLPPSLPIDPVFATAPPSATVAPEPERERRAWLPAVLDPPVDEPPALDLKAQPLDEQGLAEHDVPPTLKPLFVPNWTRAILSNAAATTSDDGPLDIERIAAVLARGEALGKLYRQPSPTLQRGVQLLVDTSEAMIPFSRDQAWLQMQIQLVVGNERMQVLHFRGCPGRGVRAGARGEWVRYQRPAAGTPVLLLTDLGIAQPLFADDVADALEWRTFADELRRFGCPVAAFVPYDRK